MDMSQIIKRRIEALCKNLNLDVPDLIPYDDTTPLEDIEDLCDQLGISIADFFDDDLFRK